MDENKAASGFISQFVEVSKNYDDAYRFIKENRIWSGFMQYGWVSKLSLLIALVVSLQLFASISQWFSSADSPGIFQSTTGFFSSVIDLGKNSGSKYLMLIFLEVLIFHCAVKTTNVLLHENVIPGFKDFLRAEKRMIRVALRSWIWEMIASVIIGLVLGMFGLGYLKEVLVFIVSCYFIGFAFLDNYNEQFNHKIKESAVIIRSHAGAAVGIGLISYVLLMIPLIGLIIGPIIGAVAATLYFYNNGVNLSEERILNNDLVDSISLTKKTS